MRVRWENSGATPALGIISDSHFQEIPDPEPESWDFSFAETSFERSYIGPHTNDTAYALIPIPKDLLWANKPGLTLTIWSWKVYRDVFPSSVIHLAEFCAEVGGRKTKADSDKIAPGDSVEFAQCKQHNCADRDCSDYDRLTSFAKSK